MTRHATVAATLALALASTASAGSRWTYGGRVGMTQNGSRFVPTAALSAEYAMGKMLSWRTDVELSFKDVSRMDSFAISVPTQLLLHPLGNDAVFDPYVGPGLSVAVNFDREVAAGAHGVVGFSVRPRKGQAFGLEGKWGWPDLVNGADPTWAMALTGNWSMKFGKM